MKVGNPDGARILLGAARIAVPMLRTGFTAIVEDLNGVDVIAREMGNDFPSRAILVELNQERFSGQVEILADLLVQGLHVTNADARQSFESLSGGHVHAITAGNVVGHCTASARNVNLLERTRVQTLSGPGKLYAARAAKNGNVLAVVESLDRVAVISVLCKDEWQIVAVATNLEIDTAEHAEDIHDAVHDDFILDVIGKAGECQQSCQTIAGRNILGDEDASGRRTHALNIDLGLRRVAVGCRTLVPDIVTTVIHGTLQELALRKLDSILIACAKATVQRADRGRLMSVA